VRTAGHTKAATPVIFLLSENFFMGTRNDDKRVKPPPSNESSNLQIFKSSNLQIFKSSNLVCHSCQTLPKISSIRAILSGKRGQITLGTVSVMNHPRGKSTSFINQQKINAMSVKPLQDRVLIEPKEADEKTASGLYIPDTAKEKPQRGKVIAVGNGKKDEPMEVKVGDEVLYGKYSGTEISVDGKDYLIVRQSDILAVV
jgi:chaperonin GroES